MYDPTAPFTPGILERIQKTWDTKYARVIGVDTWVEKFPPHMLRKQSTDGIGTKGVYHWEGGTFREAAQDFLAMNLNDLAVMRAKPFLLTNHITLPEEDNEAIFEIIDYLAEECEKRDIAIPGGETSIHNTMNEIEISGTVLGFTNPENVVNKFKEGDTLVGIGSNGLHSNGYSKIRELYPDEFLDAFVIPTMIYSDTVFELLEYFNGDINGMVHVTGGAHTKLRKPLGPGLDAVLDLEEISLPIFDRIYSDGLTAEEMYSTFNCGIGYVFSCDFGTAINIEQESKHSLIIGEVVKGTGKIKIQTPYSSKEIEL